MISPRASVRTSEIPISHRRCGVRFCFDRLPLRGLKEIRLDFQALAQRLLSVFNARSYRSGKKATRLKLSKLVVKISSATSAERLVGHLIPSDAAGHHAIPKVPS